MSAFICVCVSHGCCVLMKTPTHFSWKYMYTGTRTPASLTRCSVKFVGKDHHKKRCRIFGGIHQMRKRLLRVPISSKTLGKPKVGGQYGHNRMQNWYVLHTVIASWNGWAQQLNELLKFTFNESKQWIIRRNLWIKPGTKMNEWHKST